jgi:[CysO sulfur-carrier protein]-S-L-cysteine hydrolase
VRGVALREVQIQRYSRTILLAGVGGLGQQALLSTGARLASGGPVLLTAAAYLAASGTPIEGPPGVLGTADAGFLISQAELGQQAKPAVHAALERLNRDSVAVPLRFGTLAALPDGCEASRPLVAVGSTEGRFVLWAAGREACGSCLREAVQGAQAPGTGAAAVEAGALAALLFQRLLLGIGPALSGLRLAEDGSLQVLEAGACTHGPDVSPGVLAEAVRHLESSYPEEGCGVVLEGPTGARWVALPNAYARWAERDAVGFPRTAKSAYLFEPSDWLALLREADARGEHVAFVVHAHPDGQARFSAEDRAQAAPGGLQLLPGTAYLVFAVQKGRATAAAWVRWAGNDFREQPFSLPG